MECKYVLNWYIESNSLELIDTLWNVNTFGIWFPKVGCSELIDTLWNVNENVIVLVGFAMEN